MIESRRSPLRRGARGSVAYAAGGIAQRAIQLLLLPLYTRVLSPDEYGQIALIVTIGSVVGTILTFGLETAVLREAIRLSDDPTERSRFVNSVGIFTLVAPLGFTTLVAIAIITFAGGLGALSITPGSLILGLYGVALQVTSTVLVAALLRANERLRDFVFVTGLSAGATAILTVIAIVYLRLGVVGWFGASLASSLLVLSVGLRMLHHRWTRVVVVQHLQTAMLFGLPLLPHALAHWVLSLSDRLILGAYTDEANVGIYNLAYQMATPIGMLVVAIHQGVMPMYVQAASDPSLRRHLGRIATYQAYTSALLGLVVALLGPAVIYLVLPASYAGAAAFVPWIALGYVFYGLYLIPMDAVAVMEGRTRWIWIPTVMAAVANVGLNLALVPRYGPMAAAVDTAIAYAMLLLGVSVVRRIGAVHDIPYELRRGALGLAVVGGVAAVAWALTGDARDVPTTLARGALVLAAAAVLIGLSWRARAADASSDHSGRTEDAGQAASDTDRLRRPEG